MFKYEVTKDVTPNKIKTLAKQDLMALFTEFLIEKFGEENVGMVQMGSGTSVKRELGFIFGEVAMNGETYPLAATINPTTKEFYDHKTDKGKSCVAFSFGDATDAYNRYLDEKAEKEAIKAANKAKNSKGTKADED